MKGYHDSSTPDAVKQKWQTPPALFRALEEEFAGPMGFGLDAASTDENCLVDHHLTEADNSLTCSWADHIRPGCHAVWLNPPYNNLGPWIRKCMLEASTSGLTTVALVPAATDTIWFNEAMAYAAECMFLRGRVPFLRGDTQEPVNGGKAGSAVIVFRPGLFHHGKANTRFSFVGTKDLMRAEEIAGEAA